MIEAPKMSHENEFYTGLLLPVSSTYTESEVLHKVNKFVGCFLHDAYSNPTLRSPIRIQEVVPFRP